MTAIVVIIVSLSYAIGLGVLIIIPSLSKAHGGVFPIKKPRDFMIGIFLPVVSVGLIVGSTIFANMGNKVLLRQKYDNIKDCVNNQGYSLYIDGIQVELEHITIEDYTKISVKDDIREIHITAKK